MSFEPADFRATMAQFATGVTVVTTAIDTTNFGLTVNAFCSVSLHPSLILVSLDLQSQTYSAIRQSGIFAVNMLTREQQHLAGRFARKDPLGKTFDDIPIRTGKTGAPLFAEALAWIECRVAQEYPGGDHMLVLGEVLNLEHQTPVQTSEPLLYYRSAFREIQPEHGGNSLPTAPAAQGKSDIRKEAGEPVTRTLTSELFSLAYLFSFED